MKHRYKPNKYIGEYIKTKKNISENEKLFLEMANSLNTDNLIKLWYNDEILNQIEQSINNQSIKDILKRDLFELVKLILLWLHKSALILWGSIIEAILIDQHEKIGLKKINTMKWKTTLLFRAELCDLIESWFENELISQSTYHLCNGIRGFRNLVHPWAEYRNEEMDINSDSVSIVRTIVKKLILWLK